VGGETIACQQTNFSLSKIFKLNHEAYSLVPELRKQIFRDFEVDPLLVHVDCFANFENKQEALFVAK